MCFASFKKWTSKERQHRFHASKFCGPTVFELTSSLWWQPPSLPLFPFAAKYQKEKQWFAFGYFAKKSQESGGLGYLLPAAFHFGDCGEEQQNCLYMVILWLHSNVSTLVYLTKMCPKVNMRSTQEGLPGKIFTYHWCLLEFKVF